MHTDKPLAQLCHDQRYEAKLMRCMLMRVAKSMGTNYEGTLVMLMRE